MHMTVTTVSVHCRHYDAHVDSGYRPARSFESIQRDEEPFELDMASWQEESGKGRWERLARRVRYGLDSHLADCGCRGLDECR